MENTKSRREPNTKLGSDVNNVEKKIINLSGSLFLVSAAMLPKTNPKIIAVTTAISPSFAEILKDVKIVSPISRPVFVEIPKSPWKTFPI